MKSKSKAIFWNVWSLRYADEVLDYLLSHSDADIFCLTEVTNVQAREIIKNNGNTEVRDDVTLKPARVNALDLLHEKFVADRVITYDSATHKTWKCTEFGHSFKCVGFGSALLIQREVAVIASGTHLIDFEDFDVRSRVVQWVVYQKGTERFLLAHLHGVWIKGNTKGDHVVRLEQSRQVRNLLRGLAIRHNISKVIFGGDLNLDINTNALKLLVEGERKGDESLRNLISRFGITNTRTKLYRHHNTGQSLFADYVLVNEPTTVHSFAVDTNVLASDHAPLVVEFS